MAASPLLRQTDSAGKTNPGPQPQSQKLERNEQPAPAAGWQAALSHPDTAQPGSFLQLQRAAGNRAVGRLLQAKLTVGAAHDPYEQEADRMAQQVMSAPLQRAAVEEEEVQTQPLAAQVSRLAQRSAVEEEEIQSKPLVQRGAMDEDELQAKPFVQRGPVDEDEIQTKALVQRGPVDEDELQMKPLVQRGSLDEDELQTKPLVQRGSIEEDELQTRPLLQRSSMEEDEIQTKAFVQRGSVDEDELQMKPDSGEAFEPGADFEARLSAQRGSGSPLPDGTRQFMESRFGADFSGVRIHTGSASAQLNREVQAQAFTQGGDIFMGAGKYNPGTHAGDELLAHELTHTLQQGAAHTAQRQVQRYPANALAEGSQINWAGETASARRSSGGKTGVWFFKGISGPVQNLVIKPEYRYAREVRKHQSSAMLAGSLLSSVGINSPTLRNVEASSTEGQAILATAASKSAPIPDIPPDEAPQVAQGLLSDDNISHLSWITLMGQVSGASVESATKEAAGDPSHISLNRLLNQLKDPALLRKIGQLIALDAFNGNTDRIGSTMANLGNLMFHGQELTAIDSDALFLQCFDGQDMNYAFLDEVDKIFQNPGIFVEAFFDGVRNWVVTTARQMPATDDPQSIIDYFDHYPDFPLWRAAILAGVQEGVQKLRRLLATRQSRAGLKAEFARWQVAGSIGANWDTLRIRQKLLELRARYPGLTEGELKAQLLQYAQYRQRRANRMRGLKWTAKFF